MGKEARGRKKEEKEGSIYGNLTTATRTQILIPLADEEERQQFWEMLQ